jgi:hypothetical protein
MGTLKDVTEGIEPVSYQQALWDKLSQGGFKQGQMTLYASGRQTGKSTLNAYYGSTGIKSLYYNNLCEEIMLPGYPITSVSLKKLMPKYQFSRANWYIADFDWRNELEVLAWCTQQFGPHPQRPDAWSRWYNKYGEMIHFRDAKDYQWFLLRWGV